MRLQLYLNDKELDFVKGKEEGYVRRLVQEEMREVRKTKVQAKVAERSKENPVTPPIIPRVFNASTCKRCGRLLSSLGYCSTKGCKGNG